MNYVIISLVWTLVNIEVGGIRKCPKVDIPNGKMEITSSGRLARLSCDKDYTLDSGKNRSLVVCIGKRWNPSIPNCIPKDDYTTVMPVTKTPLKTAYRITMTSSASITSNMTNKSASSVSKATPLMTKSTTPVSTATTAVSIATLLSTKPTSSASITTKKPVMTLIFNKTYYTSSMDTNTTATQEKMKFYIRMQNTTITNNNKTPEKNHTVNDKLYIILALGFIVIMAVAIIVIICYKRWSAVKSELTDDIHLISKNNSEEQEDWSLLVN